MPVGELTRRMPERELAEWMAFYGVEPWGEEKADLRAGIISSTIANSNRRKGERAFRPIDFIPLAVRERKTRTLDPEFEDADIDSRVSKVMEMFNSSQQSPDDSSPSSG